MPVLGRLEGGERSRLIAKHWGPSAHVPCNDGGGGGGDGGDESHWPAAILSAKVLPWSTVMMVMMMVMIDGDGDGDGDDDDDDDGDGGVVVMVVSW